MAVSSVEGSTVAELRLDRLRLPAARLGDVNPLPPLDGLSNPRLETSGVPDDMVRQITYGHVDNVMPYLMQDGYDRERRDGELRVAVLENASLRATFALELGGRLWSLVHKPTGRDLVYRNPVFQPANLALRNAWFSGGVEWNIGTRGHSPTTCSPIHAAHVEGPGGAPILRMWQWERMRGVAFQIDCRLDGEKLLVFVRVRNPNDHTTPMYWWSNIAVPQTPGVRVLAPATSAYRSSYEGRLERVPAPVHDGRDYTYPGRADAAADYFFHIPDDVQPWIAALDDDGHGLAQTSTARLRGRKLFVWGESNGGHRWQDWLSGGGDPYLEIQAGVARTQYEHVPMAPFAEWSWIEAYGPVSVDPATVNGDWATACDAAGDAVRQLAPSELLDEHLSVGHAYADQPPTTILQLGDGWGALERRRRALTGDPAPDTPGTPFPDSTIGDEQQPFVELLATGELPAADPRQAPLGYVTGQDWRTRLALSDRHWLSLYHLGVTAHAAGDHPAARRAYEDSLDATPNPWAMRNLALLQKPASKARLLATAHLMAPQLLPLALEAGQAFVQAGEPRQALELFDAAPDQLRQHGRVKLLIAQAALAAGDLERAGEILEAGFEVPDLQEGEVALDLLWHEYRTLRLAAERGTDPDETIRAAARSEPVPHIYDFRMTPLNQ